MKRTNTLASLLIIALAAVTGFAAETSGDFSVLAAGAKADAVTDDTAAIQRSLDAAGKSGGRVQLPPGRYLVKGSLRMPPAISPRADDRDGSSSTT